MKFYPVDYISGFTNPKMPNISKGFKVTVDQNGIDIYSASLAYRSRKEHIDYIDLEDVQADAEIVHKTLSAGKALGGGLLFGPLGAVVGASMGGKKRVTQLTITHKKNGRLVRLVLDAKRDNAKIEHCILAELDRAGLTLDPAEAE